KTLPMFSKMFRGGMNASHAVAGAVPGVKAFRNSGVGNFVGNNMGKIQIGSGIGGMLAKDNFEAGRTAQLDSVMNLGKATEGVSRMVGATGDPRYLTPPATPAMPSFMSHT